jgi:hypothetical protein
MLSEKQMEESEDWRDAHEILDTFKAQAHGAAMGNMVIPDWVPSWQLVLEYARLRLLAVAVATGDSPAALSALASAPSMATPAAGKAPAANGSPLILPGR